MKQNRGERRYGGVMTSYQELSPITIEDDDSELEEQALFDINKARADQVVLWSLFKDIPKVPLN